MLSNVWKGDWPVTQPWGCTPLLIEPYWPQAQCHWHCGVDVGMPTGTPLFAARAGHVAYVGYGLLIIQVTPSESDSYVHIDSASVAGGVQVAQGQRVATSGNKVPFGGVTYGPHLHFEVQAGLLNKPVTSLDPIPVLTALFSGGSGGLGGSMANRADSPELFAFLDLFQLGIFGKSPNDPGGLQADVAAVKDQLNLLQQGMFGTDALKPPGIQAQLEAILAAIKAIPAGTVAPVDIQPVLDAVKAVLDAVNALPKPPTAISGKLS